MKNRIAQRTERSSGAINAALACALTLCLSSCDHGHPLQKEANLENILLTERSQVCSTEFKCVRKGFTDHFKARIGNFTYDIKDDSCRQTIRWTALTDLLKGHGNETKGLRVHYGMRSFGADPSVQWGLELVRLEKIDEVFYEASPYPDQDSVYHVQLNGTTKRMSRDDWEKTYKDPYFSYTRVWRTNDADVDNIRYGFDNDSYTFLWSQVEQLQSENSTPSVLRINAIGSPMTRAKKSPKIWIEEDWRHEVALTAVKPNGTDYLDNSPTGSTLSMKALDLGSPCPPSCVLARFYRVGLAAIDTCHCKP